MAMVDPTGLQQTHTCMQLGSLPTVKTNWASPYTTMPGLAEWCSTCDSSWSFGWHPYHPGSQPDKQAAERLLTSLSRCH